MQSRWFSRLQTSNSSRPSHTPTLQYMRPSHRAPQHQAQQAFDPVLHVCQHISTCTGSHLPQPPQQ